MNPKTPSIPAPFGIETSPASLITSLSQKCAFPIPVGQVEVRQTHISLVFLAGDLVYKVKKPVKLPFLDFSSLERRHHFCEEEVRVNSPWAPGVYLGVVPVTQSENGLRFEGDGPAIEWAVKMRRLQESETLRSRLNASLLTSDQVQYVARRIAEIHRLSPQVSQDRALLATDTFRRLWNENWDFAEHVREDILSPLVLRRLKKLSSEMMQRCEPQLRQRADSGMVREVHGDLRLEHIFLQPGTTPPQDMIVLDGIEFDPKLRITDVLGDVGFLTMELSFCGRHDLADDFLHAYSRAFGDNDVDVNSETILKLFAVYRSAVRAKVAAIAADETEIPLADRQIAAARSRAHWLWCLSEMETPEERPALILVSGLPGTGKSTLAKSLAELAHFQILRSDVIRKEIFASVSAPSAPDPKYSSNGTQQVYDECWNRARAILIEGGRVIVDATFQSNEDRRRFLQLALDCGVRCAWLECEASSEISRQRIESRRGDASDANWSVHELIKSRWEPASEFTARFHHLINTEGSIEANSLHALKLLSSAGLQPEHQ